MIHAENRRVTDTTYTTASHIPGMPYEHRVTVTTDYYDHRNHADAWDVLSDADKAAWGVWLDEYHEQAVRAAEMQPFSAAEGDIIADYMATAEWCDQPSQYKDALDEIEAARAVEAAQ